MDKILEVLITGGVVTTPLIIGTLLLTIRKLDARLEAKDAQLQEMTEKSITAIERCTAAISELKLIVGHLSGK